MIHLRWFESVDQTKCQRDSDECFEPKNQRQLKTFKYATLTLDNQLNAIIKKNCFC